LAADTSMAERADALELRKMRELDRIAVKSRLFELADGNTKFTTGAELRAQNPGKLVLMGDDPRLPKMPDKPRLVDYFNLRFAPGRHLLQSARHAMKQGHNEKIILACLLHDVGVLGFIRSDHGYWGAQLIEPYVDEEVSWAIRMHQALRFFSDESVGYEYPQMYVELFGSDYRPDAYIERDYQCARAHKWYMTARLITVSDIYAFDPGLDVSIEEFTDIIGRNFRQPDEGLGFDSSPAAHMWRTLNRPTRYL
jgi:hypothetical protein